MNSTSTFHDDISYPIEDFAPTLAQCFFIVIAGYLVARFELLSAGDLRGVNAFVVYCGMPGIICVTLADADFGDFSWELVVGIAFGKAILFVVIAGVTYWMTDNVGTAGLLAIFCVQSNDLPVGNPLMSALYKDYRPHMMKYLFLMPAMTLLLFVPVGDLMIKMHKSKRHENDSQSGSCPEQPGKKWNLKSISKEYTLILYSYVKSPVTLSTILGIVLNTLFQHDLPGVLHQPINVLAATVPGLALSILGHSMLRKERYLISSAIVPALALSVVKLIITPVLLHSIVRSLTDTSLSSKLQSDFALLYGVVSPATVVFLLGQEFRKPLGAMNAALIVTSFSCFLVSYVVARFTVGSTPKLSYFVPGLKNMLFWVAIASAICDIFVWISIGWNRHFRKVPHCYISCLAVSQLMTTCGVIIWNLQDDRTWLLYLQMAMYYGGEMSGYLWTGTIAVVLSRRYWHLADKSFPLISFSVFSLSALMTMVMCLLISYNDFQQVFMFGRARTSFEFLQLTATSLLLGISVVVSGVSILLHFKAQKPHEREDARKHCYENPECYVDIQDDQQKHKGRRGSLISLGKKLSEKQEAEFYYEEFVDQESDNKEGDDALVRRETEWKSFSLILVIWLIMIVKLLSNLYKLVRSSSLEIMIPMEFLQSVLFVGQGIVLFLAFGIDLRTSCISIRKWSRRVKKEEKFVPTFSSAEEQFSVSQFCTRFLNFYYIRCFGDLAKQRRWKDKTYVDSFWGHHLVDWLIEKGVCKDDLEAEEIGQKLLWGGVIRHVKGEHQFYDAPYLYQFMKNTILRAE